MASRGEADAYQGDAGPEDKSLLVRYTLEKADHFAASGIPVQVLRNGVSIGMIFVKEEWEFRQLKGKLDGWYTADESQNVEGIIL